MKSRSHREGARVLLSAALLLAMGLVATACTSQGRLDTDPLGFASDRGGINRTPSDYGYQLPDE